MSAKADREGRATNHRVMQANHNTGTNSHIKITIDLVIHYSPAPGQKMACRGV
jgi:hypothetical protein